MRAGNFASFFAKKSFMVIGILAVFLMGGVTGAVITTEYPQVQKVISQDVAKTDAKEAK